MYLQIYSMFFFLLHSFRKICLSIRFSPLNWTYVFDCNYVKRIRTKFWNLNLNLDGPLLITYYILHGHTINIYMNLYDLWYRWNRDTTTRYSRDKKRFWQRSALYYLTLRHFDTKQLTELTKTGCFISLSLSHMIQNINQKYWRWHK